MNPFNFNTLLLLSYLFALVSDPVVHCHFGGAHGHIERAAASAGMPTFSNDQTDAGHESRIQGLKDTAITGEARLSHSRRHRPLHPAYPEDMTPAWTESIDDLQDTYHPLLFFRATRPGIPQIRLARCARNVEAVHPPKQFGHIYLFTSLPPPQMV